MKAILAFNRDSYKWEIIDVFYLKNWVPVDEYKNYYKGANDLENWCERQIKTLKLIDDDYEVTFTEPLPEVPTLAQSISQNRRVLSSYNTNKST